jgi:hypothetical protein
MGPRASATVLGSTFLCLLLLLAGCQMPQAPPAPAPKAACSGSTCLDDLGCFPKGCDLPPGMKELCQAYSTGEIHWPPSCTEMPTSSCVQLCEREKAKFTATFGPPAISSPLKITHNPTGYRGWAYPRIYLWQDGLLVTYWGIENGVEDRYAITGDGKTWSAPKKFPNGYVVMGNGKVYVITGMEGVEDQGGIRGVVIHELDGNLNQLKEVQVSDVPTFNDVDKGPKTSAWLDPAGILHMVWTHDTARATDVYHATYDGVRASEPRVVSTTPDINSVNPTSAMDAKGTLYAFWAEIQPGEKFGDLWYSYLEGSSWVAPIQLTDTPDRDENMAILYVNGDDINAFYAVTNRTGYVGTGHDVVRKGTPVRRGFLNFGFGDIQILFDGDAMHAIFGGAGPVSEKEPYRLKGGLFYNYYDGKRWGPGAGTPILPQDFIANEEAWNLDLSSIAPDRQAKITLDNGKPEYLREVHPQAVILGGTIHMVVELNQQGTYDGYYFTLKK